MNFKTRPHFEDRQIVQYNDESVRLSGVTYIGPTVLDFTGTTSGQSTVNIMGLTGYLNEGRDYGFVVEPPLLKISGSTGYTTVDVTGYVLTSINSGGTAVWLPNTSADTNTYVTGGTITGGNLILNWNTGGSASAIDLSPITYWTAGTSGNYSVKIINDTNVDSTGNYSLAEGYNTLAAGDYAYAGGKGFDTTNMVVSSGVTSFVHFTQTSASGLIGVYSDYSVILGGIDHNIDQNSTYSTIMGGTNGDISDSNASQILGGALNGIDNSYGISPSLNVLNTLIGGQSNTISSSNRSAIIGGQSNTITYDTLYTAHTISSFIGGGISNTINGHAYSTILGGSGNTINYNLISNNGIIAGKGLELNGVGYSVSLGGELNKIFGDKLSGSHLSNATVGGNNNTIYSGNNNTIVGGNNNSLYSGSNSSVIGGQGITGVTNNTVYVPNLTIRENHVLHSDVILEVGDIPGSLESNIKGSYTEFNWDGLTSQILSNNNPSGYTSFLLGNLSNYPSTDEYGFLSYYGSGYTRSGSPTTGDGFYNNKLVLKGSADSSGIVTSLSNGPNGTMWWEIDDESKMVLYGDNLGINLNPDGTEMPDYPFQVGGTGSTAQLYFDPTSVGGRVVVKGKNQIPRLDIQSTSISGDTTTLSMGVRDYEDTGSWNGYGKKGDAFIYAGISTNGLNIVSNDGTGGSGEDYIRFFAGQATGAAGTPDINIQGSGTTRGYVGLRTTLSTSMMDINGVNGYEQLRLRTSYTPTSSGDTNGSVGDISWDNNYFYMKTNTGWGRIALDYVF